MYQYFSSLLHRPKKRAFLKSFGGLDIRKANSIRLPGSYAGEIIQQFHNKRPDHGFSDVRDYRSKLVNIGLSNISIESESGFEYNYEAIYYHDEMHGIRNRYAKINLAELDLSRINEISLLLGKRIDLYDLISLLMMIGQDHRNGSVRFVDNGVQKIFS